MTQNKYFDQGTDLSSIDPFFTDVVNKAKALIASLDEFGERKNASIDKYIDDAVGNALTSFIEDDDIFTRGPGVLYILFDQGNSNDISIEKIVERIASDDDDSSDEDKEAWAAFFENQAKKIRDHIKSRG